MPKAEDPRPADRAIDGAWAALHARLDAYAKLDADTFPRARRARELIDALFPEGLAFLRLPHAEEWAESEKRLRRIAADGLEKELDTLAGRDVIDAVRAAHERYGRAVGVTAAGKGTTPSNAEPLREVSRAVVGYALEVVAAAQECESDSSAAALLPCLRPIDDLRADIARRTKAKASSAPEQTPHAARPDAPLPDVPPVV